MYCQVIVDIVHENVAKPFTYRIPEGMSVEAGQRVAVPFGPRQKEAIVLQLTDQCGLEENRIRSILHPLEDYAAIPPELMELAREMAVQSHCPLAETLRLMLPAQMRGGRVHVKTEKWASTALPEAELIQKAGQVKKGTRKEKLLRLMADGKSRKVSEINETVPRAGDVLRALEAEGLIRITEEEVFRIPAEAFETAEDPGYTLTASQQEALSEILPALKKGNKSFLLHGVTGSGKTEVFIAAVQEALRLGKSAIILVPEIALTPQMVSWFRGRFGSIAAVIHSRLSTGERYDEWRRIRRGDARVVIGARSAVFSPVQSLGLIVVDEEHESSYFSDHHPRYDAREVALSRIRREGACLVLASATPSILSFARARRGDYILLEMPRRVNQRPLPEVEIADMRRELEDGNRTVLSKVLRSALKECVARGDQAMLLMNRRGYHSFVSCRSCGYVVKCPHCDVSMTYHINDASGLLHCHYCGEKQPLPAVCPECGGKYIRFFGAGTQKVEEEVRKLLPDTPLVRMDYDTTSGKDGHGKILEAFRSGKARVLIGTQMIAKGLDFPEVTLVGVVAADMTLNLPDYRSRERTFQLLTQVAGRAGRGRRSGRVIIQTYKPEDPVIGFAARQDYRAFFEEEFRRRRNGLYPPFTMLGRILCESLREHDAERITERLEKKILELEDIHPDWKRKILLLLREAPSVSMLRGRHRRQILMKLLIGPETDAFLGEVTDIVEQYREDTDSELFLEINPTNMI